MLDRKQLAQDAVRIVELIETTPSVMAHQVGQYCYLKREGGGPHYRFRSEFPGDSVKEDDIHILAYVFAELSKRIEAKYERERQVADSAIQESKTRGRGSVQNQA